MKGKSVHIILFILMLFGVHSTIYAKDVISLDYTIKINDFNTHEAQITMSVSGISENYFKVKEVELGGSGKRIKKDKISQFVAINTDTNETLPIKMSNQAYFDCSIQTNGAKNITITYTILKDDSKVATGEVIGYIGEDLGVFSGGQILLAPYYNYDIQDTSLSFELPEGIQAVTPFEEKDGKLYPLLLSGVSKVYSMKELDDNLYGGTMAVGNFTTIESSKVPGIKLSVAVHNSITDEYRQQIKESMEVILEYQTQLFGQVASNSEVPYLIILYPNLTKIGSLWVGESCFSQGVNIENNIINYSRTAHQTFHRWNGWLWGWEVDGNYTKDREMNNLVIEGLNDYYVYRLLIEESERLFNVSPNEINGLYQAAKKFIKNYPKDEAYAKANDKYGQGGLFFFLLDMQIREDSAGKYTLDDVVKALHSEYRFQKKRLTYSGVTNTIKEITGKDYRNFFEKYIFNEGGIYRAIQPYLEDTDGDGYKDCVEIIKETSIEEKDVYPIKTLVALEKDLKPKTLVIGDKELCELLYTKVVGANGTGIENGIENKVYLQYEQIIININLKEHQKWVPNLKNVIRDLKVESGIKHYQIGEKNYIVIMGNSQQELKNFIHQLNFK